MRSNINLQVQDILTSAYDDIVRMASEVGIDGERFLQSLPAPGQLMTGMQVPVLHTRHRNCCYVIFHINRTSYGLEWPFIKFHTFKSGGHVRTFNGFRWLKEQKHEVRPKKRSESVIHINEDKHEIVNDQRRLTRHTRLHQFYSDSNSLRPDHPWLEKALSGYASDKLINRTKLKIHKQQVLAPMFNEAKGNTGFHCIVVNNYPNQKRHYVKQAGLLSGSYVTIDCCNKSTEQMTNITLICEGLTTGLSLALIWPGVIRVALCAGNLQAVRSTTQGPVIICCDNDQWKPKYGNVGRNKARAAIRPGDILCCPKFPKKFHHMKPTDFNDLLKYTGLPELQFQLNVAFF